MVPGTYDSSHRGEASGFGRYCAEELVDVDSTDLAHVRRTLWAAADELRANSSLAPNEYRGPVLGLIFLAYAEHRFEQIRPEVEAKATARRPVTPDDYRARSVLFVPDEARLSLLVNLPEKHDLGAAVDTAMRLVETHNAELRDVLPKGYQRLEKSTLVELLRLFSPLPRTLSGDAFGLIYEDFLSNFALAEGRLGGEFFTPHSIVRLIVEIIEPFHGRVFDPAGRAACSCNAPSSSSATRARPPRSCPSTARSRKRSPSRWPR